MANKKKKMTIGIIALLLVAIVSVYFYLPAMLADEVYPLPDNIAQMIVKSAQKYGVDPALVCGVIFQESRFDANARSSTGVRGIMQVSSQTAHTMENEIGLPLNSDLTNSAIDIEIGTAHIHDLLVGSNGNEEMALASYNLGTGAAAALYRSGGSSAISSFKYVKNIEHYKAVYRMMYAHQLGYESASIQLQAVSLQTQQNQVRGFIWTQIFQKVFHIGG